MNEEEKIKSDIKEWIAANRAHLPLNIDSWEFTAWKSSEEWIKQPTVRRGAKYDSALYASTPFYKPYSKMCKL